MAKVITITPTTGSGSQQLSVSATSYTGRNSWSMTYSASGTGSYSGVSSSNMLTVTQGGSVIMRLNNPGAVGVSGGSVTITGESNLAKLKLTLDSRLTFSSATVNGVSVSASDLTSSGGYTVPGDPGADEKYDISIVVSVPQNTGSQRTMTVSLGDGTDSDSATVTQNGSAVVNQIWFSNGSSSSAVTSDITVTLDADGNITGTNTDPMINTSASGVSWTIS